MKTIPQPKDNLATIALVVCLITAVWAVTMCVSKMLSVSAVIEAVIAALSAVGLCGLMFARLPVISLELRTRTIGIILCSFFCMEWAVLAGGTLSDTSGKIIFFVVFAFLLLWFTWIEPRVYLLLGGTELHDGGVSNFGLPKDLVPNGCFSQEAENIRLVAGVVTVQLEQPVIGTGQILLAIIARRKSIAGECLAQAGAKYDVAKTTLVNQLGVGEKQAKKLIVRYGNDLPSLSTPARNAVMAAVDWSRKLDASAVKSEHLLLGLLDTKDDDGAHRLLSSLSIDAEYLRKSLLESVNG